MISRITQQLQELQAQGLYRQLRTVDGHQSKELHVDGGLVLNFCSNNYLGLADHPHLVAAAQKALSLYGVGSGASRLVCGNFKPYAELEQKLAALKNCETCLVFNSGYAANTGIIPALFGRNDFIFSDRLNHASIVDGILLSRAQWVRYPHLDLVTLEKELSQTPTQGQRAIITDSVFSMDGDAAPLRDMVVLARRYEAHLIIDEAHAFGLLGEHGAGLAEELGVSKEIDVAMGTLSKAGGCFGAYVGVSQAVRDFLINRARSLIYTTALPPAIVASAAAAVNMIASDQGRKLRDQVKANAVYVRQGLNNLGFDTMNSCAAIIPVLVKDPQAAVRMSRALFERGIFVQAIRPPTVPVHSSRLRITVMATHTRDDLDQLLAAMRGL